MFTINCLNCNNRNEEHFSTHYLIKMDTKEKTCQRCFEKVSEGFFISKQKNTFNKLNQTYLQRYDVFGFILQNEFFTISG